MSLKTLRVDLLTMTTEPLPLIYAAFRQCYHAQFVSDMWPQLVSGEISKHKQAELVQAILESGHESPIEHVSFTFAVEGISRACSHQLVRHRIASYSQQSQRYVNEFEINYVIPPAIAAIPEARKRFERIMKASFQTYQALKGLLNKYGRARQANEDARFVLPQATETKIVITMNCRSLLHFFSLRCCVRAQWEIREMALAMLVLCRSRLPVIFDTAGAQCERLGYCLESKRFTCGRYPLRDKRA